MNFTKLSNFARYIHKIKLQSLERLTKMDRVFVRAIEGEDRLQITLKYALGEDKLRVFNLNRPQNEELAKSIDRLVANIQKETNKASKKKKKKLKLEETVDENVQIRVFQNGDVDSDSAHVDLSVSNLKAFSEGNCLVIGEQKYIVSVNAPTVTALSLPQNIMAGFPIHPKLEYEFADFTKCKISWYKSKLNSDSASNALNDSKWEKIYDGFVFTPSNDLIGWTLKVVCVPGDGRRVGEESEAVAKCEVTAGPGHCPFIDRHIYTQQQTDSNSFRCVTYNILADLYADSDYTRETLYPYCPPYALGLDYRKQLYTAEILGYNGDIVALQECDRKVYLGQLMPIMETEGFRGLMVEKVGQVPEGTAIFFRTDKFRLVEDFEVDITQSLSKDEIFSDLWSKVCESEGFKERMLKRNTALQIAVLESVHHPGRMVVVATTHLYFHPSGPHVRMVQTAVCMSHIEQMQKKYKKKANMRVGVILLGDLNTGPEDGNTTFITEGLVTSDHAQWSRGGPEEYVSGMEIRHGLKFVSACGYPSFTNYTGGFKGCLDYIYVDREEFSVSSVVPLPSEEELSQHVACPNAVCPSDHLPLICDLTWSQQRT